MDFAFWIDQDRVRVKFVSARALGSLSSGHSVGGDYRAKVIRLFRGETRRAQRATFMHELGHYLVARQELRAKATNEEEICDVLTWLPAIWMDERNGDLLEFLGLTLRQ